MARTTTLLSVILYSLRSNFKAKRQRGSGPEPSSRSEERGAARSRRTRVYTDCLQAKLRRSSDEAESFKRYYVETREGRFGSDGTLPRREGTVLPDSRGVATEANSSRVEWLSHTEVEPTSWLH